MRKSKKETSDVIYKIDLEKDNGIISLIMNNIYVTYVSLF